MVLILLHAKAYKSNERTKNKKRVLYPNKRPSVFLWQGQLYKERIRSLFYGFNRIIWEGTHHGGLFEQYQKWNGVYGAQAAAAEHWYRKSFWSYIKQAAGGHFNPRNDVRFFVVHQQMKAKIVRVMRTVGKIDYSKWIYILK
jgi:monofunctional biosynthetic peptidoglycan transglycosylase